MNNVEIIEKAYQRLITSNYFHFKKLNEKEKKIIKEDGTLNKYFYNSLTFYGKQCDHITEIGIGGGKSGTTWLYCKPKKLVGIDNRHTEVVKKLAEQVNIEYELITNNSKKIEIEQTDLLFLEGNHPMLHVLEELRIHSPKVKKYIIGNDINAEEEAGFTGYEVEAAFIKFLIGNKKWKLVDRIYVGSGLIIIKRVKKE